MKVKPFLILTILFLLLPAMVFSAYATEPAFHFDLAADGKNSKEVETGDIITVNLKLQRADSADPFTMYAMQDEIRYDSSFFELVEGSAMLRQGISSTDIALTDQHREFYMNYLSMSGGDQWQPETLIGSFQLKVIGSHGITKITNQDFRVSLPDGSGSYACEATDLTIILSTDCIVTFHTNGGNDIPAMVVQFGERIPMTEMPNRDGYQFDGWYTDKELTAIWNMDTDTVQGNIDLYVKWVEAHAADSRFNLWPILLFLPILVLLLLLILLCRKSRKNKYKGKFSS